jgi:hypothetical protein
MEAVGKPSGSKKRFVDVFCGAGALSLAASRSGWHVHANDHLLSSSLFTEAQLIDRRDAEFKATGGYEKTVRLLNAAKPVQGAIFAEYSPSGQSFSGHIRRYFTCSNAAKIDGIRITIETLYSKRMLSKPEYHLLLADLIRQSPLRLFGLPSNVKCAFGTEVRNGSVSIVITCILDDRKVFIGICRPVPSDICMAPPPLPLLAPWPLIELKSVSVKRRHKIRLAIVIP